MTTVDEEVLERIRERLRVSTRVGDDRVQVEGRGDAVVLGGAVATPEEATVAAQLAEEYADMVLNELAVDGGLREGMELPVGGEPAVPPEGEELVGSTDMFAGPGAGPTEDMAQALDENEPWSPPDVPQDAPTGVEQRHGVPLEQPTLGAEDEALGELRQQVEEQRPEELEQPAAPDLSAAELRQAAEGRPLPSLDPTATAPPAGAEPDVADDERTSGQDASRDPGLDLGPGALAEPVHGSGAVGGTAAVPTGAATAGTDPGLAPPATPRDIAEERTAREEELGDLDDDSGRT